MMIGTTKTIITTTRSRIPTAVFAFVILSVFSTLQCVESQAQQQLQREQQQIINNIDCNPRQPLGIGSGSRIRGGAAGRLCNEGTSSTSNSLFPGVPLTRIRSIDGSEEDIRGSAGAFLLRLSPSDYPDGPVGDSMTTEPNARLISNLVSNNNLILEMRNGGNRRELQAERKSDMIWIWGQFLDHDMDLTTEGSSSTESSMSIVSPDCGNGDFLCTIPFTRSVYMMDDNNERQQMNEITSFIDASMVYGSDMDRSYALREFHFGRLRVDDNNMLLYNVDGFPNGVPNEDTDPTTMLLAGDVRANEQIGLTAMHIMFTREHNRLAGLLFETFPASSDEDLYQMARKIVGAEIQKITYDEFLPELLGPEFAPSLADYTGYDSDINPAISTEFSTVAFRVGHTMLSNSLMRPGMATDLPLMDAFFNPRLLMHNPMMLNSLISGFCHQSARDVDTLVVDAVRNFLFGIPLAGSGLDLASLNIQRGRDHGIQKYNNLRVSFHLAPATTFEDITSNERLQQALRDAYGTVDNIDAWVGGLAENHVPGGIVGELFATIMSDQFTRSMLGDPMFFLNDDDLFNPTLVENVIDITNWKLADVIAANTDLEVTNDNVFQLVN